LATIESINVGVNMDLIPSDSTVIFYDLGKCFCGEYICFNSRSNREKVIQYVLHGEYTCDNCGEVHKHQKENRYPEPVSLQPAVA